MTKKTYGNCWNQWGMDLDASKNGGLNQRKCWDKTFYAGIPGYATNNIVFGLAQKWGILRGVRYTTQKNIQFFKIIFHQEYYSGISELLQYTLCLDTRCRILPQQKRQESFHGMFVHMVLTCARNYSSAHIVHILLSGFWNQFAIGHHML